MSLLDIKGISSVVFHYLTGAGMMAPDGEASPNRKHRLGVLACSKDAHDELAVAG
jgi:hypothetical protein